MAFWSRCPFTIADKEHDAKDHDDDDDDLAWTHPLNKWMNDYLNDARVTLFSISWYGVCWSPLVLKFCCAFSGEFLLPLVYLFIFFFIFFKVARDWLSLVWSFPFGDYVAHVLQFTFQTFLSPIFIHYMVLCFHFFPHLFKGHNLSDLWNT